MHKISAMDERHKQGSLSRDFGSRIERLLQTVKSFVAIVGPCVQSSQIASIVVGGLNFVLSVSLQAHIRERLHVYEIPLTLWIEACAGIRRVFRPPHDHDGTNCGTSGLSGFVRLTNVSELIHRSKSGSPSPAVRSLRRLTK